VYICARASVIRPESIYRRVMLQAIVHQLYVFNVRCVIQYRVTVVKLSVNDQTGDGYNNDIRKLSLTKRHLLFCVSQSD